MDQFEVSDLKKGEIKTDRFYQKITHDKREDPSNIHSRKLTNSMIEDMEEAIERLFGEDDGITFDPRATQGTLVDGVHYRNSREGYNRNLCLRIDLQGINKGTEKEVSGKVLANVQIQLNASIKGLKKGDPTTIAQVHFQCGKNIPKDRVIKAFQDSWTGRKVMYVYVRDHK